MWQEIIWHILPNLPRVSAQAEFVGPLAVHHAIDWLARPPEVIVHFADISMFTIAFDHIDLPWLQVDRQIVTHVTNHIVSYFLLDQVRFAAPSPSPHGMLDYSHSSPVTWYAK